MSDKLKWGVTINTHYDAFLLGANINIGRSYNENNQLHAYACLYFGFWTIIIGRDYR